MDNLMVQVKIGPTPYGLNPAQLLTRVKLTALFAEFWRTSAFAY
jgi:hypothetical protein